MMSKSPTAEGGQVMTHDAGDVMAMARTQSAPDVELLLPARAENVAIVRHALGALGEVLEVDEQTLSDIRLAVTEACTNVVVHAYPNGEEGPLEVLATLADEELTVVVRDEGEGISPRQDSPGLGLGLPLIASLAEKVQLGHDAQQAHGGAHDVLAGGARGVMTGRDIAATGQGAAGGPVLCRVVSMVLARADCPVDRLDDALLACEEIATHGLGFVADGHLSVTLKTEA